MDGSGAHRRHPCPHPNRPCAIGKRPSVMRTHEPGDGAQAMGPKRKNVRPTQQVKAKNLVIEAMRTARYRWRG